jgi:hypothetical protein
MSSLIDDAGNKIRQLQRRIERLQRGSFKKYYGGPKYLVSYLGNLITGTATFLTRLVVDEAIGIDDTLNLIMKGFTGTTATLVDTTKSIILIKVYDTMTGAYSDMKVLLGIDESISIVDTNILNMIVDATSSITDAVKNLVLVKKGDTITGAFSDALFMIGAIDDSITITDTLDQLRLLVEDTSTIADAITIYVLRKLSDTMTGSSAFTGVFDPITRDMDIDSAIQEFTMLAGAPGGTTVTLSDDLTSTVTYTIDSDYRGTPYYDVGTTSYYYTADVRFVGRYTGGSGGNYRTLIRFPLSDLPSSPNVVNSVLKFTVSVAGGSSHLTDIHPYNADGQAQPSSDSAQTKYNRCQSGTPLVNDHTALRTATSYEIDLGAAADTDIENAKAAVNRYTVGLHEEGENDNYGQIASGVQLLVTVEI